MQNLKILGWILCFVTKSYCKQCMESLTSLQKVRRCPETNKELSQSFKMCEDESQRQNCTTPSQYSYHCVFNTKRTLLLEVCAPHTKSKGGHCIAFDSLNLGFIILNDTDCTRDDPVPCPIEYSSTESYKYTSCRKILKEVKHPTTENPFDAGEERLLNGVLLSVLSVVIVLFAVCIIHIVTKISCCRKHTRLRAYKLVKIRRTIPKIDEVNIDINATDDENNACLVFGSERAEGFDKSSFRNLIKNYELESLEQIFKENDIDCIRVFLNLSDDDLDHLGLTLGQRKKCLSVISILHDRNKKIFSAPDLENRNFKVQAI